MFIIENALAYLRFYVSVTFDVGYFILINELHMHHVLTHVT